MLRGRSERTFGTLQDRLGKERGHAGITDIEAANAFIREVYWHPRGLFARHNARFAAVPAGEGLAFTPVPTVCARISSRRGPRSVSIPVHVYPDGTPSFTGRAASAATTSGTIRDVKSAA